MEGGGFGRVHFVAIVAVAPIVATFRTSGVRFVAIADRERVSATKCTRTNQQNVALTRTAPAPATFLPYSQHFVAITGRALTIATKYCLYAALPSRR
jgi:hypothetical protein